MMLLALAGNMGGLGAMGFPASPGVASAKIDLLRSEVRAAPPKPNPACLKKCRRVTAWINPWYSRFSGRSLMAEPLMSSILTDNFRSRVAKKVTRAGDDCDPGCRAEVVRRIGAARFDSRSLRFRSGTVSEVEL